MLEPGTMTEAYQIVRLVGSGGMCEVYEARDVEQTRRVAIKVLRNDWLALEEVRARFVNEAHLLGSIHHPHIISLLATGRLVTGAPFMVLDWWPDHVAGALVRRGGAFAPSTAVAIGTQVAGGLAELHERGIVHRDLTAANVLLRASGSACACLADLGLAKRAPERAAGGPALEHVSTASGARLGTWDYMAPEQWIESKTVTPQADVYSLGVLLFLMLAGRPPFPAEQAKDLMYFHLFESPPLEHLTDVGAPEIPGLLARMLDKTAAARPDMKEVVSRLEAIEKFGS